MTDPATVEKVARAIFRNRARYQKWTPEEAKRAEDKFWNADPEDEISDALAALAAHEAAIKDAGMVIAPRETPAPNPEFEAKADAAHEAIRAEVGEPNPFDTLTMLEKWKSSAEPADCDGRISFSRALLDSAQDALRVALEMARREYLLARSTSIAFGCGAQECREMMARFVEEGGDVVTAASIRANWNSQWGIDPGAPRNMRDHGWLGPALHDKVEAIVSDRAMIAAQEEEK